MVVEYTDVMSDKDKKNKNTGIIASIWVLAVVVLIILFIVMKDVIISNLKSTKFFDRVFGKTPTFIQNHEDKDAPKEDTDKKADEPVLKIDAETGTDTTTDAEQVPPVVSDDSKPVNEEQTLSSEKDAAVTAANQEKRPAEKQETTVKENKAADIKAETKKTAEKKSASSSAKSKENTKKATPANTAYTATFYFVEIDSDGSVSRKSIKRSMPKSDSPMTDVLKSLLAGPLYTEQSKGYMTLIPENTRLLSATVREGVAYLNFSEEFEFNKVGVEGYLAQLMQIVYTATSFSTVNSVQFMIEGQKKEYLGSEGVWIGSPLSRSSFK